FRLVTPWGKGDVRLSLRGAQQVPDALAAAAAARPADGAAPRAAPRAGGAIPEWLPPPAPGGEAPAPHGSESQVLNAISSKGRHA
ncbi:MAG TPA: hypothetical protein VJA16_19605, partial [Thermoanaerobaculia bacterium]